MSRPDGGGLILVALLVGCQSAPTPTQTAPLTFPEVQVGAVAVSSARFLGVDPGVELTNSQLRNCRFGRNEKIPLVPALVEVTPQVLRVQGQEVLALADGHLPAAGAEEAIRAALEPFAAHNRALAERACYPWRAGPDDPAATPTLLIAADAAASASDLLRVSEAALAAGLELQALWVRAQEPAAASPRDAFADASLPEASVRWAAGAWSAHVSGGLVLSLDGLADALEGKRPPVALAAPPELAVSAVVEALGRLRVAGLPCARLQLEAGAVGADARHVTPSPEQRELQQLISVLPLSVGGGSLVSGERCQDAQSPENPALLEMNTP